MEVEAIFVVKTPQEQGFVKLIILYSKIDKGLLTTMITGEQNRCWLGCCVSPHFSILLNLDVRKGQKINNTKQIWVLKSYWFTITSNQLLKA